MELTINGVSVKLTADEILSALLSDEAKGLWELKRKLDELEHEEFKDTDFGEIKSDLTEDEVNEILGLPTTRNFDVFGNMITDSNEKPSSDTELPPSQNKPPTIKKKYPKHRRKRINPKTGKRYYHRKRKSSKFVGKEHKPIINTEDDPIIIPAKRPSGGTIDLNL